MSNFGNQFLLLYLCFSLTKNLSFLADFLPPGNNCPSPFLVLYLFNFGKKFHGNDSRKTKAKMSIATKSTLKVPMKNIRDVVFNVLRYKKYSMLFLSFPGAGISGGPTVTCHQSYLFGDRSAQWWPLSPSSIRLNMHKCSVCTLSSIFCTLSPYHAVSTAQVGSYALSSLFCTG